MEKLRMREDNNTPVGVGLGLVPIYAGERPEKIPGLFALPCRDRKEFESRALSAAIAFGLSKDKAEEVISTYLNQGESDYAAAMGPEDEYDDYDDYDDEDYYEDDDYADE